jgi:RNA polymerase sigma factor (sigma-70 family)
VSTIPVVDDRAFDDRAFERLYRRYVRDVYRFALVLVRNPSEAEDVTQTTFLNAYRALKAGEEPRRPQSWLLTIAHNAARSRGRRALRRPREVPLDDVVGQLTVPEHERPNVRELLRALRRLPLNQRAAITMRELEGRSYPEIAETLGVSVPAVEALLARARRTLRLQAAAIRGLVVVGLPRSLRRLSESGEAATGGTIAKAAAVVAAGVVAGGAGFTAGTAGRHAPRQPARADAPALVGVAVTRPPRARPAQKPLVRTRPAQTRPGQTRPASVPGRSATPVRTAERPARMPAAPASPQARSTPAPAAAAPAGSAPPDRRAEPVTASAQRLQKAARDAVLGAVQLVSTVAPALPAPAPAAATPPLPTPPVGAPPVQAPAIPTVPPPPPPPGNPQLPGLP